MHLAALQTPEYNLILLCLIYKLLYNLRKEVNLN